MTTNQPQRSYSNEEISRAIKMIVAPSREDIRVLGKAPTYRAVSKRTNISVSTLHRYANVESVQSMKDEPNIRPGKLASIIASTKDEKNNGVENDKRRYITITAEHALIAWIFSRQTHQRPAMKMEILQKAYELRRCFDDDERLPGEDWYSAFMTRNSDKLKVLTPTKLSMSRALASTKETALDFFTKVDKIINQYDLGADDIIAFDETGIHGERGNSTRVVVESTTRNAYLIDSGYRLHTTLVHLCIGNGSTLPPLVLFTGSYIPLNAYKFSPIGTMCIANKNGYLLKEHMPMLIDHIISNTPDHNVIEQDGVVSRKHLLVIMDGAPQHLCLSAIEQARSRNIHLLLLPPHTSHLFQVSDVSIFGPFKHALRDEFIIWHSNHPNQDMTNEFAMEPVMKAFVKASTRSNVKSGFYKCGIYPQCPTKRDQLLDSLPSREEAERGIFASHLPTQLSLEEENTLLKMRVQTLERFLELGKENISGNSIPVLVTEAFQTVSVGQKRVRRAKAEAKFLTEEEAFQSFKAAEKAKTELIQQRQERKEARLAKLNNPPTKKLRFQKKSAIESHSTTRITTENNNATAAKIGINHAQAEKQTIGTALEKERARMAALEKELTSFQYKGRV